MIVLNGICQVVGCRRVAPGITEVAIVRTIHWRAGAWLRASSLWAFQGIQRRLDGWSAKEDLGRQTDTGNKAPAGVQGQDSGRYVSIRSFLDVGVRKRSSHFRSVDHGPMTSLSSKSHLRISSPSCKIWLTISASSAFGGSTILRTRRTTLGTSSEAPDLRGRLAISNRTNAFPVRLHVRMGPKG